MFDSILRGVFYWTFIFDSIWKFNYFGTPTSFKDEKIIRYSIAY